MQGRQLQIDKIDISIAPPHEHKRLLALHAKTQDNLEFDSLAIQNRMQIYLRKAVNDLSDTHTWHEANKTTSSLQNKTFITKFESILIKNVSLYLNKSWSWAGESIIYVFL